MINKDKIDSKIINPVKPDPDLLVVINSHIPREKLALGVFVSVF
jgi:hypothetical protein